MTPTDNITVAGRFLASLFAPYKRYPTARIELRAWTPKYDKRPDPAPGIHSPSPANGIVRQWFPITAQGVHAAAAWSVVQSARRDVYTGVLPRVQGKGGADALRVGAWLWCDIDGGDGDVPGAATLAESAVKAGLPKPHIGVVSGSGLHCYWRLLEPAPCHSREQQERYRRTLRRLVRAIGGESPAPHADIASAESVRVLRVPGTVNRKRETDPRPVRLVRFDVATPCYPLVWWCANLPAEPLPPKRKPATFTPSPGLSLPPLTRGKIEAGAAPGARHHAMRDVAVSAVKEGYDEAAVRALVEQTARASGLNPGDGSEARHITGIVEWAVSNVTPEPWQRTGANR